MFEKKTFQGLESLKTLKASGMMRLKKVEEGAFSGASNLESLYLEDNPLLSFLHPGAFRGAFQEGFTLRKLHLAGNNLKYATKKKMPGLFSRLISFRAIISCIIFLKVKINGFPPQGTSPATFCPTLAAGSPSRSLTCSATLGRATATRSG